MTARRFARIHTQFVYSTLGGGRRGRFTDDWQPRPHVGVAAAAGVVAEGLDEAVWNRSRYSAHRPETDEHEESVEMMANNTDRQVRHVFDEWHRAVEDQDAVGTAALYAQDGVLETSAVSALRPEREDAVLRGRDAIALFLRAKRSSPRRRGGPLKTGSAAGSTSPASGC